MADNQTTKLTILHSNDIHGDFTPEEKDGVLSGGIARLAGYINQVRNDEDHVIFAVAGDMFKGSIIDSEYRGISTIELMNMLYPDVATLGNHEIDYGLAHLLFIEKCATFPIINANLFITTNHTRLFNPYFVIKKGDLKILFIGILTDEVLASTKSEAVIGSFVDVREAAEEVGIICDSYKTVDIDYTVILSHIGFDKDQELASLLSKEYGVDLIIGGHTHTLLTEAVEVNGIKIVQAGTGTDQIGRIDLTFEKGGRGLTEFRYQIVPINENTCEEDPYVKELFENYKSNTDQKYRQVLTTFKRKLTHPARNQETELGNLFADMMQEDSSFDLMILGSGSLRLPELGPVLHVEDLKVFFPYDDALHLLEVTGEQLKRMVAFILRDEAWEGHTEFYQFSKGFHVKWSKSRHEFLEFTFHDQPVADDDRIKIALQDYHFNNFTEFFGVPAEEVFKNRRPRIIAVSCCGIYEEMFMNRRNIDAHVEGRITIVD